MKFPRAGGKMVQISMGGMVWSAKGWQDCLVTLIDVGDDFLAIEYKVRLTRICVVLVEMEG